ncbi:nuclear transport factor 2 family protein [Arthrobacter sp. W4I7]|uniref:YybH family protein n=1 Tax=Arthrobacter sp. W4I7 TaxID=3042296 RepID=UPI002783C43A|nr:nuclear transport factor 2 family protein [Arthrobacter sp. W4I7]MDQ0690225.1 ketosteroid isomerase-like protein [Arthrobacter sp. W4I7]
MDFDAVLAQYHDALDAFAKGDARDIKRLYSHRDDVVLANPFGPAVQGWAHAEARLDFAVARFRDGECSSYDSLFRLVSDDMAVLHELEHWKAKVSGRSISTPFVLRVTTVFRREDGTWLVVLRHADPISSVDENGPLRAGTA